MLHGAQGFPFCAGNWNGDKRGIYRKNSRLKLFCTKSMCIGTTQKRTKRLSPFWVVTFSSKMSHKTVFVTCAFRPHRIAQAHAKRLSRSAAFFSKIVALTLLFGRVHEIPCACRLRRTTQKGWGAAFSSKFSRKPVF